MFQTVNELYNNSDYHINADDLIRIQVGFGGTNLYYKGGGMLTVGLGQQAWVYQSGVGHSWMKAQVFTGDQKMQVSYVQQTRPLSDYTVSPLTDSQHAVWMTAWYVINALPIRVTKMLVDWTTPDNSFMVLSSNYEECNIMDWVPSYTPIWMKKELKGCTVWKGSWKLPIIIAQHGGEYD